MPDDKLKPCPFCGGDAKRITIGDDEPNNAGGDVICCTRCQASSHVEFGRKENLVSRWNSRVQSERASMEGEIERLLLAGTVGLTSFDGHCVRVDFQSREDAERMFETLLALTSSKTGDE